MKKHLMRSCLVMGLLAGVSSAHADTTLTSSIALPSDVGSGLDGSYYAFTSTPGNLANTQLLISQMAAPSATFTATTVCFPSCGNSIGDGASLTDYLGGNAVNVSANNIVGLSDHAVVLNGYIAIATAGTYQFGLTSDDGSQLQIGGTTVINNDGDHGFGGSAANVQFIDAGLYAFNVLAFEDGGSTGVTVLQNNSALATSQLYSAALTSVPLPGTAWLFASVLGGLGVSAKARGGRKAV
jgi:hypothetical protein